MYSSEKKLLSAKLVRNVLGLFVLALCTSIPALSQGASDTVLIHLRTGQSPLAVLKDHTACLDFKRVAKDLYRVHVRHDQSVDGALTKLNKDARLTFAERDVKIHMPEEIAAPFMMSFDINSNSTLYAAQAAYPQIDLGPLPGDPSGAPSPLAGAPNATVPVAILDTGIDLIHPDLQARILGGVNIISPSDTPAEVMDGKSNSAYGHGTMIAGIIARTAPHSIIMPIRVLNADGDGSVADVIQGIYYAIQNGARVINMSFTSTTHSRALKETLLEARLQGIVLVAAAGNDSNATRHYPAAYHGVLAVASVNSSNILSGFSDFGKYVDVCAPGEMIRSTFPTTMGDLSTGGYATWSGTSFATPFVAAEAAELAVRHPHWSANRVADRIVDTAISIDSLNPHYSHNLGAGLVDVITAVFGNH